MDPRSFDSLARRLAARASRRSLIAMVATAVAGVGLDDGASAANRTCRLAAQKCVRDSQCCSGNCAAATRRSRIRTCVCTAGQVQCGGDCADFDTDRDHCGGCNQPCDPGFDCVDGACTGCASSQATRCLVTIEGEIVERNHTCLAGTPYQCSSSQECADLGSLNPGWAAACVTELYYDGSSIGFDQTNRACVGYAIAQTCSG